MGQEPTTPLDEGAADTGMLHWAGVPAWLSVRVYVPGVQPSFGDLKMICVCPQTYPTAEHERLVQPMSELAATANAPTC